MKSFGENLATVRKSYNISQKALAKLLGTTQQRVSEWERGLYDPKIYYVKKICILLDTTFDELTDDLFPDLEKLKKSKK